MEKIPSENIVQRQEDKSVPTTSAHAEFGKTIDQSKGGAFGQGKSGLWGSAVQMKQERSFLQRTKDPGKDDGGKDLITELNDHLNSKDWQKERVTLAANYVKGHDIEQIGAALAGACLIKNATFRRAFSDLGLSIIDQLDKNSKGDVSLVAASKLTDEQLQMSPPELLVGMYNAIAGGRSSLEAQHYPKQFNRIRDAVPMAFINKTGPLTPEEINTARTFIAKNPDATKQGDMYEKLQAKPQYSSQRDNKYEREVTKKGKTIKVRAEDPDGQMCNLTSLAMCLSYLGISNPYPAMQYEDALEKVRVDNNYPDRDTSDGWGKVAEYMGVTQKIFAWNVKQGKDWYAKNVKDEHLRKGDAVMMSITGHIVRIQAVTDDGLVVDDPYGKSKLEAGKGRSFSTKNKSEWGSKKEGTANEGEDNVWDWDTVKAHEMFWIVAFTKK